MTTSRFYLGLMLLTIIAVFFSIGFLDSVHGIWAFAIILLGMPLSLGLLGAASKAAAISNKA